MKKVLLLITLIILAFSLCACKNDGTPSGMKLISGGENDGYYFYVPSEWTVSNIGNIKSAYVSRVDRTSVSFAEIKGENINDEYFLGEATDCEISSSKYFKDNMSEFPSDVAFTKTNEAVPFGKKAEENMPREDADVARLYEYNYTYKSQKIGFTQIFIKEGERYFVFTFSSPMEERFDSGESFYAFHQESLKTIIDSFRFVEKKDSTDKTPEYTKDSDGYILISDRDLCRFDLYVPESFTPDYASAIVSATHTDGSNINMTEVATTGVDIEEGYWKLRKEELSKIVTNLVIIKEIKRDEQIQVGNASAGFECEYTFDYNGTSYHVYQVFCIDRSTIGYGYALTYTATEQNYENHLTEIQKVVEKVRFK